MSYARQAVTRLTLNMGLPDAQGSFSCTSGDVNRRLEVTLIDHGEPFALPPDWTAFLAGVKPDGTRLANSCVVDRGRIIYDFSGGAEIATCPGVFAVVFEVYDELGELVATPKVWVHVADNAGARIVNSADQFSVLSELIGRINGAQEDANDLKVKVEDLMDKAASAGTVTIPMSEWTDAAPTMASVEVSGVDMGSIILMLPADEKTRLTANNAKLSAYPVAFAPVGGDSSVSIFRAEAETIPDSDMTFAYIVLKTGFSFATPVAAIVGVDAYGEGGGGSGGGVDRAAVEAIVKAIVPEWARESIPPAETDPTISDWAKAKDKPTYSKDEVGLGNVDNVKQYSKSNPPPYPVTSVNGKAGVVSLTAGDVGARPASWTPTADDVGADPIGTASAALSSHNVNVDAHNDIRLMLQGIADRLNAVLDSDDTTLDELSEIVAYIKSNKDLIDDITDAKVSVDDIINNLTTNVTNKPLSAAQGVEIKKLIDGAAAIGRIYVGDGTPPDGAIVWVNPNGTPLTLYTGEVEEV